MLLRRKFTRMIKEVINDVKWKRRMHSAMEEKMMQWNKKDLEYSSS